MPSLREQEYRQALDNAISQFLRSPSIPERCGIAGAQWEPLSEGGIIRLPFFKDLCEITVPDFTFSLVQGNKPLTLGNQILILHYLNGVKEIPLTTKPISFKDIPAGEFYYPAFVQRSIKPLLQTFGHLPEAFRRAAEEIGSEEVREGDVGVMIRVFPQVPVTLVLWLGDDEFPPDLTIVFDSTVSEFLSTEDIAVLSQEVMLRMIRSFYSGPKS